MIISVTQYPWSGGSVLHSSWQIRGTPHLSTVQHVQLRVRGLEIGRIFSAENYQSPIIMVIYIWLISWETGVGFYVPLCFTSPNYKGDIISNK